MTRTELCTWLRANSSGIYRPAADAASEIERLECAAARLLKMSIGFVTRMDAFSRLGIVAHTSLLTKRGSVTLGKRILNATASIA